MKKISFTKIFAPANRIDSMFLSETCFGTEFRVVVSPPEWFGKEILFHGTEFQAFLSTAERFGTEFREFSAPRNRWNSAGTNQLFRLFRLLI
jgi:hypothetical protein